MIDPVAPAIAVLKAPGFPKLPTFLMTRMSGSLTDEFRLQTLVVIDGDDDLPRWKCLGADRFDGLH